MKFPQFIVTFGKNFLKWKKEMRMKKKNDRYKRN